MALKKTLAFIRQCRIFISMEYIESSLFSKIVGSYLEEEEDAAFQWDLALHPEKGDLIPGSGGLRKIRWADKGKGKRGGVRIIYY